MATVNKNFKVKNGLVVEGTVATVNGNQVLTVDTQSSDSYILNLVGGAAYITSVKSDDFTVTGGELTIAAGSTLARTSDITSAINNLTTSDIEEGATNQYFTDARAVSAITGLNNSDYYPLAEKDGKAGVYKPGVASGLASESVNGSGITTTGSNGNALAVDRTTVDGWYEENGAVSDHNDLTTGVHGVTGDVVGTTDTQTLSNKSLKSTNLYNSSDTYIGSLGDNGNDDLIVGAENNLFLSSTMGDVILSPAVGQNSYLGSATAENEIATHGYVDNAVSGLSWKQAVNLLSTTNVDLFGNLPFEIDQHAISDSENGYRILLTGQTTDSENGIYVVVAPTALSYMLERTQDADSYEELIGAAVYVMEGTQFGSTSWVQGDHYLTDFTGQTWTQFSGQGSVTAGDGIIVDGLEVSVDFTVVAELQDLTDGLALKQDTLTAGDGIDIDGSSNISVDPYNLVGSVGDSNFIELDVKNGDIGLRKLDLTNYTDTLYDATGTAQGIVDALDTDDIEEGSTNLYYTDYRATQAAATLLTGATKTNIEITGDGSPTNPLVITAENGVAGSTTDDLSEGEENLYFTDARARDAVDGTDRSFTSVELNSVAKQIAATLEAATAGIQVGHAFAKADYRSAEYLVKVAYGDHTEISKVLLTLDVNDNIAITEYGIVGTNGSASTISAGISGTDVQLLVTTANNNSTVTVVGTLLA
jgi:hypothetical protein